MTDRIIVTVADEYVPRIDDVAERLRDSGMRIDQVLGPVGIITGSIRPPLREAIVGLPGVAAVEDEGSVQLAPPDADVQ